MAAHTEHTVHEITRKPTKQHEPMLIFYALSSLLPTRSVTLCAKPGFFPEY